MGRLYTILAEYRGGTYISQIEAETPTAAIQRWSETQPSEKGGPAASVRLKIKKQLATGDAPVPLSGRKNVWCMSGTYRNQLILVNVVLTWSS